MLLRTRIEPLLNQGFEEVDRVLDEIEHEVIVVDKSDDPPTLTDARAVIQQSKGLRRAIVEGLADSKGEWLTVKDGDFSQGPEDLAHLPQSVNGYDFLLGSR